jgi:hypothetical protein
MVETMITDISNKLEFHVNMYVKTYRWLQKKETWENAAFPLKILIAIRFLPTSLQWLVPARTRNLVSNAVEDSHLAHARILYEFLAREKSERYKLTDIRAFDFYQDDSQYVRLDDSYLKDWSDKIGARGFHLTTKHLTARISDFEWSFDQIAQRLLSTLRRFFNDEAASKIGEKDREQCVAHLDLLQELLSLKRHGRP